MNAAHELKAFAQSIGFSLIGITRAEEAETYGAFRDWLNQQFHGSMSYLERRAEAYRSPEGVMVGAMSIVMLGANYQNSNEEHATSEGFGKIARYARGGFDYHDVLREKLSELSKHLKRLVPGCRTRNVVDTAPLLERDYARKAGLGWIGKNTMLINKHQGSYVFLSALLTDASLEIDAPHSTSHCGSCTRCLEACPTDAFVAPHVLDARKCISYLTIEHRSAPIETDLRPQLSDWIFGCDICQEVCPWNRRSLAESMPAFRAQDDLERLDLIEILGMNDEDFTKHFEGTPMMRPGRIALQRTAAILAGNQRLQSAKTLLQKLSRDDSSILKEAAAWAIEQINSKD